MTHHHDKRICGYDDYEDRDEGGIVTATIKALRGLTIFHLLRAELESESDISRKRQKTLRATYLLLSFKFSQFEGLTCLFHTNIGAESPL